LNKISLIRSKRLYCEKNNFDGYLEKYDKFFKIIKEKSDVEFDGLFINEGSALYIISKLRLCGNSTAIYFPFKIKNNIIEIYIYYSSNINIESYQNFIGMDNFYFADPRESANYHEEDLLFNNFYLKIPEILTLNYNNDFKKEIKKSLLNYIKDIKYNVIIMNDIFNLQGLLNFK